MKIIDMGRGGGADEYDDNEGQYVSVQEYCSSKTRQVGKRSRHVGVANLSIWHAVSPKAMSAQVTSWVKMNDPNS